MKFKKFLFSHTQQTMMIVCLLTSAVLMTAGGISYQTKEAAIQSLESLRNGLGICSTRVGQSHYALLSGADSAKAMTSNYFSSTDECFFQLDRKIDELGLVGFKSFSNDIYDEFINYKNMAKNFSLGSVPLSRITQSFNRIDQLRFEISGKFASEIRSGKGTLRGFRYLIIFAIALLGTSLTFYMIAWSSRRKNLQEIETTAYSFNGDYKDKITEVERLIEQVLDQLKVPAVKNLFLEYNTFMLERAYPNQKTIEFSQKDYQQKSADQTNLDDVEIDEDYINSVFEKTNKQSNVIELSPEDLELTEEELEDQWVSSSSLNNESSYEFTLADEFDQLVGGVDEDDINSPQFVVSNETTANSSEDNSELKQISAKVKEVLGETNEVESQNSSAVSFNNPIGQKISDMIHTEANQSLVAETEQEEVSFQKVLAQTTKAYIARKDQAAIRWEFVSNFHDFEVSDQSETLEQVLYSAMTRFDKGFKEAGVSMASRFIKVSSNLNSSGVEVEFRLRGSLFNTAELEYFNHAEQSVKKLIDRNLVTAQELISSIGGAISLRNEMSEHNVKEGIVILSLPLGVQEQVGSENGPILRRIVKGTKSKLLKSLRRETTI